MAPIMLAAARLAATNEELLSSAASLVFGLAVSAGCAYGCWYFAKNSGRNEALAIVWGIMCGLIALIVYLVLYSQDNSRRRKAQAPYYPGGYAYHGQPPHPPYPASPPAPGPAGPHVQALGGYCPRCGTRQVHGAVFCEYCGEKIPGAEPQPWADGLAHTETPLAPGPAVKVDAVTPAPRPPAGPPPQPPGALPGPPVPPPPPPAEPPKPSQWK